MFCFRVSFHCNFYIRFIFQFAWEDIKKGKDCVPLYSIIKYFWWSMWNCVSLTIFHLWLKFAICSRTSASLSAVPAVCLFLSVCLSVCCAVKWTFKTLSDGKPRKTFKESGHQQQILHKELKTNTTKIINPHPPNMKRKGKDWVSGQRRNAPKLTHTLTRTHEHLLTSFVNVFI